VLCGTPQKHCKCSVRHNNTAKIKSIARWLILIVCIGLATHFAIRVIVKNQSEQSDLSNYTVSQAVTKRVIELFDGLGTESNELIHGGTTDSAAVGSTGIGSVMQFDLRVQDGMLGIHRLRDHKKEVIRFSYPKSNDLSPIHDTELSASLTDDERLRQSFDSLLKRLEATDPFTCRWLILQGTEGDDQTRAARAERVVAPNRSLPPSQKTTSPARGPED
jgi:hypothetical protein